jgi:eukaryotic-like serine/threonine-protein kinase
MTDHTGQYLGNYRLIRLLGQGGFAEVYLAEHLYLGTPAAIKLLRTQLAGEDTQTFRNEARTIARLIHPHIVRVFDFGIEGATPFLVMDYAPGGTVRKRHPKGVALPLPTILDYVKQTADALQYAHDEHFIHRDVKPENLLLGRRQELLLGDFGTALLAQTSRSQSMQDVAGTASYMAPEQFQGKPRPQSDQYALAIMVYEWLTGACPFHGSFPEIASQHLFVPPPPLQGKTPTISPALEQVVMSALAKDPHQRFASVQAFATAFQQACQLESSPTQPSKPSLHSIDAIPHLRPAPPSTDLVTAPSESFIPTELVTPPSKLSLPTEPSTPASQRAVPAERITPPSQASLPPRVLAAPTSQIEAESRRLAEEAERAHRMEEEQQRSVEEEQAHRAQEERARQAQAESRRQAEEAQRAGKGEEPSSGMPPQRQASAQPKTSSTRSEQLVPSNQLVPPLPAITLPPQANQPLLSLTSTPSPTSPTTEVALPSKSPAVAPDTLIPVEPAKPKRAISRRTVIVGLGLSGLTIASGGITWWVLSPHPLFTYHGHTGLVRSVVWSPDGKRIASGGGDDGTVQVWNANDGSQPFIYRGHTNGVNSVAWSPDGQRIASGSYDKTVQVWNANDGSQPFIYRGHYSLAVTSVAWSPDGTRIASGGYDDKTVQVWNANDGSQPFIYRDHIPFLHGNYYVRTVAWSPDGKRVASGGNDDGTVQVWQPV